MKHITLIVAATPKGEIGYQNTIPWKLKGDLARFKEKTMNNIVIMGRNTFESLPSPLKDRQVIVVTSQSGVSLLSKVSHDNVYVANSLEQAFEMTDYIRGNQVFIAGGTRLYEEVLKASYPCTVELTVVHKEAPHGYDAIIKDFSMRKFELNEQETQTIYAIDPETNIPIPSHTYCQYIRD